MTEMQNALILWQHGPYVNEVGLIVVPLHPTLKRNWYTWEALGFKYDGNAALVRSAAKEHNGKCYSLQAWLQSTLRKFREFYPEWDGESTCHIEPQINDPLIVAQRLYQAYGGDKAASHFYGQGYPAYSFAGAIKNQFGVTDKRVRGKLQQIARETYATFDRVNV
ncbi:MAG: hypothetical protein JXA21_24065 [Anaerolineae bacterium]|nr:hypothetical protein [Anaerolineae bacterium]